jgi:putative ABC transport system ATP-binding protein
MGEEVLLSARSISKRVSDGSRRREVIHELSLDLCRRELVVVRGASGSGKTTLLALLGGMLLPTSGEVWLGGEPMSRLRDHQRAALRRDQVGYVFQDFGLLERMSVIENVLLPLVPVGGPTPEAAARAGQLLERFGLTARRQEQVSRLSGGERQRVALARAFVTRPRVLLLDEPTAHLDEIRAAALMDDLASVGTDGTAVLVATHDPRVFGDARISRHLDLRDGVLS